MAQPSRNISLLVLFPAFLITVTLVLWLSLRHQTPNITIINFAVPTSSSSDTNWGDKSHHGPDIALTLMFKNPSNTYTIIYNTIMLTVYYNHNILGKTLIPGFKQGKTKEVGLSCHIEANVQLWETLLKALSNLYPIPPLIKVELNTVIQYKNLGHKSKQHDMKFQGQFNVGSDGKISGKKRKVKLHKVN